MSISIPSGVNLRSSEWTTSILRHYDFGLEAICFEPLVSFSYTFRHISFSFLCNFVLYSFIEAGDVTRRRRCQNRSEEFRKISKFFAPNFFFTQICLFWHNSPRNDENNFFWKNQNFDPPNFWTPLNFSILKDLITLHPCTKFGVSSSKGVGARGHEAGK